MTVRTLVAVRDTGIAGLLAGALGRYGFTVETVGDGAFARSVFEREPFDVLLLDTWLGKTNGITLAGELRTTLRGRGVGIVLLNSGPATPAVREQSMRRSIADAWFDVPFSTSEVRRTLAELAHLYTGAVADGLPVVEVAPRSSLRSAPSAPAPSATAPRAGARSASIGPFTSSTSSTSARAAAVETRRTTAAAPAPTGAVRSAPESTPALVQRLQRGSSLDGAPASRLMLALCRARASGVLSLRRRSAEARVAFLRGVIVGAADNGHDNRLGPRLLRRQKLKDDDVPRITAWRAKHGGRIGDAILGLGLLPAATLLEELREQAREQVAQAASWQEGDVRFVGDDSAILSLASAAIDVVDVVIRSHLRFPDMETVARFVAERGDEVISSTVDFEEGLVAYARQVPRSSLPMALLASMTTTTTTKAVLAGLAGQAPPDEGSWATHLHALWCAGLVRLARDAASEERPVPRPWRPQEVAGAVVDAHAVEAVQRAWLRVQGRSFREALYQTGDTLPAVERVLRELEAAVGPAALAGKKLGPAETAARELAVFLEEARVWLVDVAPRELAEAAPAPVPDPGDVHDVILRGRRDLRRGAFGDAVVVFEQARARAPQDIELMAWLGWSLFLEGKRLDEAVALLQGARYENPTAARPLLFLAQVAEQRGDRPQAERWVQEARRRCPDDPDVAAAALRLVNHGGLFTPAMGMSAAVLAK